jgi:hypothetical protein
VEFQANGKEATQTAKFIRPRKKRGRPKGAVSKPRMIGAVALRKVFRRVQDQLKARGLTPHQLPSNDLLASKLVDWLSDEKIDDFVKGWVKTVVTPS